MSTEKRKDTKNRLLKTNEYQKSDGRYEYRYVQNGKMYSIYSWRLIESDPQPKGKKLSPALRTMEKEIQKDIVEDINFLKSRRVTLNEMFEKTMKVKSQKYRPTTKSNYYCMYNCHIRKSIGMMTLEELTPLKIASFYSELHKQSLATSTLFHLHSLLKMTCKMAVKEKLLRVNPFSEAQEIYFSQSEITYHSRKEALTREQEKTLLDLYKYRKNCPPYLYPMVVVALNTGLRVGELCGLQFDDIDFQNGIINVQNNLVGFHENGEQIYLNARPKTENGIRKVPMLASVKEILLELKMQEEFEKAQQVGLAGLNNFVFTKKRKPILPSSLRSCLYRTVDRYNNEVKEQANEQGEKAILLPRVTPHIFRHTFATRLSEYGVPLIIISYLLGHSTTRITEQYYISRQVDAVISMMNQLDETIGHQLLCDGDSLPS